MTRILWQDNFARIRFDSFDSSPAEKVLTFHNVIVLIKSVVKKNESEYCYDIFLGKGSCKDKHNAEYFHMNVCVL